MTSFLKILDKDLFNVRAHYSERFVGLPLIFTGIPWRDSRESPQKSGAEFNFSIISLSRCLPSMRSDRVQMTLPVCARQPTISLGSYAIHWKLRSNTKGDCVYRKSRELRSNGHIWEPFSGGESPNSVQSVWSKQRAGKTLTQRKYVF